MPINKESFLKSIKSRIKPLKRNKKSLKKKIPKVSKKPPVFKVGPAKASFPITIPGRTKGETGLQTSLTVREAKASFPRIIKGRKEGETALQTALTVKKAGKQPKIKVVSKPVAKRRKRSTRRTRTT